MRTPLIFPLTYTNEERAAQVRAFNDYFNNFEHTKRCVRVAIVMSRWLDDPKNERVYTAVMARQLRADRRALARAEREELQDWLNLPWEERSCTPRPPG